MALWDHLKELKNRLIKSAIGVVIGGIGGWILYDPLLKALADPVNRISQQTGGLSAINFGTIPLPSTSSCRCRC
jgi:sec-independent protein translocase protein TatC